MKGVQKSARGVNILIAGISGRTNCSVPKEPSPLVRRVLLISQVTQMDFRRRDALHALAATASAEHNDFWQVADIISRRDTGRPYPLLIDLPEMLVGNCSLDWEWPGPRRACLEVCPR